MPENAPRIRCDQAIRPTTVDNCCTSEYDVCPRTAAHRHQPTGISLCAVHWENAMTMGGPQDGHWQVGMRILPFPDGWEDLPEPETPPEAPPSLWVAPSKTAGGLIIEL
ncbi:MAG: hypothetical protein EPO65_02465 [Dehalococcoidia bacterium]|nr:MAG: hypothetical protein EPO65_02465 [Dehalococcoidia bacterium]